MKQVDKIKKDTILVVGNEVLFEGYWKKIIDIKPDFILLENSIVVSKEDLVPNWELEIQKDFSNPREPEFSIAIVKVDKEGLRNASSEVSEVRILLFDERSGITLTKYNVEKMTDIAKKITEYMNSNAIAFEKG